MLQLAVFEKCSCLILCMGVTLGNGKSSEPPSKVRLDIQAEAQKPLDGKTLARWDQNSPYF